MNKKHVAVEPSVLVTLYDFTVWFLRHTNRFPKNLRVTLGDRIDASLLGLLDMGQRARLRKEKLSLLEAMNEELNVLRLLVRLSVDLGCLGTSQYEYVSLQIDEIGRQLGGWIKQQRAKA